jgi:hypothetical protein
MHQANEVDTYPSSRVSANVVGRWPGEYVNNCRAEDVGENSGVEIAELHIFYHILRANSSPTSSCNLKI